MFKPSLTRLLLLACLANLAPGQDSCHLYFGHGGHVTIEQPQLPLPDQGLTIECWFRSAERLRRPVALLAVRPNPQSEQQQPEDQGLFSLILSASNSVQFSLRSAAGQETSVSGLGRWLDGKWHRISATWDGLTMSVYVDGKLLAQNEAAGFAPLATSQRALVVGPWNAPDARTPILFDGSIGGVRIWNRALSAAEVAAQPSAADGCISHYPLTAKQPSAQVADAVATGRVGRLREDLARAGWLRTRSWQDAAANDPGLDLFCYDLADVVAGAGRHVLVEHSKQQRVGVLWQDAACTAIAVTWVDASSGSHQTHELSALAGMRLAGGTSDDAGNLYYLTIQDAPAARAEGFEVAAVLHKARFDGSGATERALDVQKSGLNIYDFSADALRSASMRYSNGVLGVMLPRRMHMSGDGLRHQGAIALAYAAKDLQLIKNHGQTSGHSMANYLSVNSKGNFVALDLGDNYPRGVHLHEFDKAKITSRLVFTFKTEHATSAKNGIPVYDEISGDGRTFYKWSNDNAVYTELGGLVEDKRGYTIVFATDQGLDGRVLDNSRAYRGCQDPRNLALVRVVKNFGRAKPGSEISDNLMVSLPRKVVAETGGYFDFSGGWHQQRVVGVTWLTQYGSGDGAHAPQLLPRDDGNIVVLWEKRGNGAGLHAAVIEPDGKFVTKEFALPFATELNRQDRVLMVAGSSYLLANDGRGGEVRLYFVKGLQ